MLETASERLSAKGGPHWASPDKVPARRLETIDLAGELRIPFTSGILIGIGETRAERLEALDALRELARAARPPAGGDRPELPRQARHAHGRRIPSRGSTTTSGRSRRRGCCCRPTSPCRRRRTSPTTTSRACSTRASTTGAASRRSRSTTSTPRRRGPSSTGWRRPRARAASSSRRGCPSIPEFLAGAWLDPARAAGGAARVRRARARARGRLAPRRRPARVPFVVARDALPVGHAATSWGRRSSSACSARAARSGSACSRRPTGCAARSAATRSRYVVTRNIQYTNVCYFRCGFCAFSKGKLAANLRGAPYLVPHEEIVRRAEEAWERGATEVCLQGGIHPAFTGEYYASVVARSRTRCRTCTSTRSRRSRSGRARRRSACRSRTTSAMLRDARARRRCRARRPRSSTTRCARSSAPTRSRPRSGSQVHEAAHRVGLRSNVTIMFGHVERPRALGAAPAPRARAAAASGGFTEFVPLPFVHMEAPMYLQGPGAVAGRPSARRCSLHAVARLALHPAITNIQASWVKLGPEGVRGRARAPA